MYRSLPIIALLALTATTASAYEMRTSTWAGSTVTLEVNLLVPALMPDHYDILQSAEDKVDANASALRFALTVDDDATSDTDNGESELDFTDDSTLLCGSLACAWVYSHGDGTIDEADVYIDEDYDWAMDDYKWDSVAYDASGTRPLINTAMHELLHTLGVKHENDCINLLGNAWNVVSTNGDYTEVVVSEDTTAGLVATYGARASTLNDLSVMHWKFDSASTGTSAYSSHMRSQVYDAATGAELTVATAFDELTYKASRGQDITVEMTLENRGTSTENRKFGVYWSDDETITTADTLLFASNATLSVGSPFEHSVTVSVPLGVTRGEVYWVGAIIDRDDALSESNEVNNAAYIAGIKIK